MRDETRGGTESGAGAVPRGKDEFDFLKSRQDSTPERAATLRATLGQLLDEDRRGTAAAGRTAHAQGTTLVTLYMRHADPVLGYPSFRALLEKCWRQGVDDALRRMRIARFCTEDEAAHGISMCDRGIRLMGALELASFGELLDDDKPLHLKLADGTSVRFAQASVHQLEDALRVLGAPEPPGEASVQDLTRTRGHIDGLVEEKPAYARLHPTALLQEGVVEVRVRARGRAQQLLASKFFADLAKKR